MSEKRAIVVFSAAVALIAALIYLPSLNADFTGDSRGVVLVNDYVHHLGNLADVVTFRVMRRDVMDNNRPFYLASVILDWAAWGPNPAGHHLTNILLHATVAVLLFLLCRKLLGEASGLRERRGGAAHQTANGLQDAKNWISFGAALLFAAHPLNCEAVAEISYRKDLIAGAGILGTLYLATFFRPVWSRKNFFIGCGCALCALVAVATKENGAAAAPALFCYWLFFRRKEKGTAGWMALCGTVLLVTGGFLAARFTAPPAVSNVFTSKPQGLAPTFGGVLKIQTMIWAYYLRQIIYPHEFCADYGPYSLRGFVFGKCLAAVLAVVAAQFALGWRNRLFALGAALFWLSLLPVSNLVPLYRPVADRFLYVPLLGVALMIGSSRLRRAGWFAVFGAVYLALAAVTVRREMVWHDNVSLWSDTLEKNPRSDTAADNLAYAYLDMGDPHRAIEPSQTAIRLSGGRLADAFAALAIALDETGNSLGADAQYEMAVQLDPRYGEPEKLVQALVMEKQDADRLEKLRARAEKSRR